VSGLHSAIEAYAAALLDGRDVTAEQAASDLRALLAVHPVTEVTTYAIISSRDGVASVNRSDKWRHFRSAKCHPWCP
jgi:hypothetical protein